MPQLNNCIVVILDGCRYNSFIRAAPAAMPRPGAEAEQLKRELIGRLAKLPAPAWMERKSVFAA